MQKQVGRSDEVSFGTFAIDHHRGCVRDRDGAEHILRPKSFRLLAILASDADRLVSKDDLAKRVWPDVIASDDSIAHCVSDIRRALGPTGAAHIRTVPKRGYMLVSSPGSTPTSAPARWPVQLGTAAVAVAFTAAVLAVALPWPQIFSGTGADATEGRNAAANDAALIRANNVLDDRDWSRRAENAAARRLLEDTLARNPGDAEAWASLGLTYWQEVRHLTWGGGRREMRQALSMAERSMALEPTPRAHRLLAEMRLLAPFEDMRDPLDALAAATAAVQMDPNDPDSLAVLAMVRALGGDAETAVGLIERARRLNPNYPAWYARTAGIAYLLSGAPARAAEELRPLHAPDAPVHARAWSGWLLAASLAQAGRRDEAAEIVAAAVRRRPELSLDMVAHSLDGFYRPETREPVLEGLRLAGLSG